MNGTYQPLSKDGTIPGIYLGWVIPDTNEWEALVKLTKSSLGYHLNPTSFCVDLVEKYKGIPKILGISGLENEYISTDIPSAFEPRIPVERKDVGEMCKSLGLDFPGIDPFAFMARTGGCIHGDPFSVCPILAPNNDGNYEFYCRIGTTKDLQQHWDSFTKESKLECHDGIVSIQLSGNRTKYPAIVPDFFARLEGSIVKAEILNISQPSIFGVEILTKITFAGSNPYASSTFSLLENLVKQWVSFQSIE